VGFGLLFFCFANPSRRAKFLVDQENSRFIRLCLVSCCSEKSPAGRCPGLYSFSRTGFFGTWLFPHQIFTARVILRSLLPASMFAAQDAVYQPAWSPLVSVLIPAEVHPVFHLLPISLKPFRFSRDRHPCAPKDSGPHPAS
jgi:hypothetical protein